MKGLGDDIISPLCGEIYKEEVLSIVTCSGTYTDINMNWLIPKKSSTITGDDTSITINYNWRTQMRKKVEEIGYNYAGSDKFSRILR